MEWSDAVRLVIITWSKIAKNLCAFSGNHVKNLKVLHEALSSRPMYTYLHIPNKALFHNIFLAVLLLPQYYVSNSQLMKLS